MLHDWNSLIWNQKENVYVNVTWLKQFNMKSNGNVYVNVTWLKQLNMKSKGKCLCECYMTETVQYEIKWKCLCKCYMIETVKYEIKRKMFMWMLHDWNSSIWNQMANGNVNVTWLKQLNMKSKGNV
jgi:hypothetical protein